MTRSPSLASRVFAFFCSFGLATFLLSVLLLLTFLGTLEQVEHGLFDSQKKYFESWLITSIDLGACLRALSVSSKEIALPILLPGGMLAMALLTLSMICGGLVRIRKSPRTIGVIIAHFSIVFMLISGAVEYSFKKEGNMALLEGQTSDEFQSFHKRVIEIEQVGPPAKDGKRTVLVIHDDAFSDLTPDSTTGKARTFTHASLPFELTLMNYQENSEPHHADGNEGREVVDGYYLQPKTKNTTAEQNIDGIYASVKDKSGAVQKGILWGAAAAPWTVKVDGKTYLIDLSRERWHLPFAVRLDKFEREVHPGTERARKFSSQVTKLTGGHEEKKVIKMNEPLRDGGYVLFQASFSQGEEGAKGRQQSVFEVVQNPADNWPLYSCIAVAIGLLIHFISMLARFVKRTSAKAASAV
ncbi:MAG: hypothetical protein JWO94_1372 [Verrucomicrobiaceae bacterium]|nr:hypothetical protein [Verrucomicrobiaceae bacterium]